MLRISVTRQKSHNSGRHRPQAWLTPEPMSTPPDCTTSPGQLWLRYTFLKEQVVGALLCCLGMVVWMRKASGGGPAGNLPTLARNIHVQAATPIPGPCPGVHQKSRNMGGHLPHPSPFRWDKSEVWSPCSPGGFFTTEPPGKPYNTSVHLIENLKSFVLHVLHVTSFVFLIWRP